MENIITSSEEGGTARGNKEATGTDQNLKTTHVRQAVGAR